MEQCLMINVSGKVQGVFFRASTQDVADKLNIKGWVKNEYDGSVSICAQGTKEQVDTFVQWCKNGPAQASVDSVDLVESENKDYPNFEIRYY